MDEQYLINGIITRNKVIFDFIFHYYYSGLCAYCERITGNKHAAEDIVQDLFLTLWVKHQQIKIQTSLKRYLFTAVKNRSFDYLKHENKKSQWPGSINEKESSENFSTLWFAEAELQSVVNKSLDKLPPRCREIFKLSRMEGIDNEKIANKLGLSKRTVELQISNALRQLRNDLKNYLPQILLMLL